MSDVPALLKVPKLTEEETWAIQSVARGDASEGAQKLAMDVILEKLCRVGLSSVEIDPYMTQLNEGRRLVGLHIIHILNKPKEKL
jgi:hypothetical protein